MAADTVRLPMKLYSYVVARDFGFAPNPFHGVCTLATCKPRIREKASLGDWVIGTGAKTKYRLSGHLIYAMAVSEVLDFDAYWADRRFRSKRPVLNGSLKLVYGDNIYHREEKRWVQANSHHSRPDGRTNAANLKWDTSADRVLVGSCFVYFGEKAPPIPNRFRPFKATGEEICAGRGYRVLSPELCAAFVCWLERENRWGLRGFPLEFAHHPRKC
jgi:Nucleotide modification associated domain 2